MVLLEQDHFRQVLTFQIYCGITVLTIMIQKIQNIFFDPPRHSTPNPKSCSDKPRSGGWMKPDEAVNLGRGQAE